MDEIAGFQLLQPLLGCWAGIGRGSYPTIPSFEYIERVQFVADAVRPLIHYEQFTRQRSEGERTHEPSHWESGFLRPVAGGLLEISNAQDGGRVEVLRGPIRAAGGGLELELESLVLAHDARLVRTRRTFGVNGDRLHTTVAMHTTRVPDLVLHLQADLVRLPAGFKSGTVVF